jgi:predicted RNA-binding protein with PUA-like domain
MSESRYWLFKSEPNDYSFSDLWNEANRTTEWDGVRNFQARNYMRDDIKTGDGVLFYHSNSSPLAIVGTARVVREAYPDVTALDYKSVHYDPKSTSENSIWVMVDIQYEMEFAIPVTLQNVKRNPELQDMILVQRGSRLSVQPVTGKQWSEIIQMGREN